MEEYFVKKCYEQSLKAFNLKEIPIGCIVVKDDKIIASTHNQKEKYNNPIKHAEIIAIEKACKKLKTWCLEDCTMYVTSEPCVMCIGAISQARIKKVFFAVENKKFGYSNFLNSKNKIMNQYIEITKIEDKYNSSDLLKKFFEDKRN